MGISALGSKIASDVTGCPKKAVLILYSRVGDTTQKTSAGAAKGAASALNAVAKDEGPKPVKDTYRSTFLEVQYNPGSLRIQGNSKPVPINFLLKHVDNGIPNQAIRPPSVTMTVDLTFDDTNIFDAFMFDKGTIGIGSAITAGAAVANRHKGYSVQTQTNALVAALMRADTNKVSFAWAGLHFGGSVTQAQAKYTMFSVSGKPIRSVVRLVISQALMDAKTSSLDQAFDACFKSELSGSGGSKSAIQKAGNLLNVTGF